jgi:protein O-mannosyl-transferase
MSTSRVNTKSPSVLTTSDDQAAPDSGSRSLPPSHRDRLAIGFVCLFLAGITWLTFGQTLRDQFVNYDDDEYVFNNPKITGGLTLQSVQWAFTHVHANNWHPLTSISHMLDCTLYGLQPWGHHLTNVLLHALAAILLFLALLKLTGRGGSPSRPSNSSDASEKHRYQNLCASAFVAAVFAVHPLRVESVAWVSERKDVLSGVFFMLTLLAYAEYVRQRGKDSRSLGRYLAVVILFALGLMSKPTLVTLPFVLLLLDYWPLSRYQRSEVASWWATVRSLVVEKLPLFALSAVSCVVTVWSQGTALEPTRHLTLIARFANAVVSYGIYVRQMFYPTNLAVFYPYPTDFGVLDELVPLVSLLALISTVAFLCRKKFSFLVVGWCWFLGILAPMIGVIQAGSQGHADRYTYLTQIGLYILITWGAIALFDKWRPAREILVVAGLLLVTTLSALSYQASFYWRNSETLWRHTLQNTSNNYVAHNNFGHTLVYPAQLDEAILHFRAAIRLKEDYVEAHNNLADALMQNLPNLAASQLDATLDEAIAHLQRALQVKPDFAEAWTNLATALVQKGNVDEAVKDYHQALELAPDLPEANGNLGNALLRQGHTDEAIASYNKAIELRPAYADAHHGLGKALIEKGRLKEAIEELRKTLTLDQNNAEARYELGSALLQIGHLTEATEQLQRVVATSPSHPEAHHNLAVSFAQMGQFDRAIAEYREAIELRPDYAQAECNLGNVLLRQGTVDEAIVHLENAIRINASYWEAYNDLGSAFMSKGNRAAAVNAYKKAIELRPDYAEAHSNLGNAYLQNGQIDDAIAQDRQAVAIAPNSAAMQLNLGNALVAKGNRAEAIECYQTALRIQPNYANAQQQLRKLGVALPQ